ncbi:MAG: DUF971 domain-containing protein [Sulfuriferula sp.]|nr:DUF971 domain-containing protein [Sulfuriferula sp.]
MPNNVTPVEIRQNPASATLEISWNDGYVSRYGNAALRRACRCTTCRQLSDKHAPIPCPDDISIVSIDAVGAYAIQIGFSDGHDRGIFPWEYLRKLENET